MQQFELDARLADRPLRVDRGRLQTTLWLAEKYACDIAVTNGINIGLGDILVITPLIEQMARHLGRRIRIATAPFDIRIGKDDRETKYPVWDNNPFVSEIVEIEEEDWNSLPYLYGELKQACQFSHIIENNCFAFGLRPGPIRPRIYLTAEEQIWAFEALRGVKRPILCLHPGGKTAPSADQPWGKQRWLELVDYFRHRAGFLQIGFPAFDRNELGILQFNTTVREMFALVWASDLFVGFDSSPMHVARAFTKPSLILWDALAKAAAEERSHPGFSAAVMLRWGYPENRNLMILNEQDDNLLGHVVAWVEEKTLELRAP